jgi:hypothetical protein
MVSTLIIYYLIITYLCIIRINNESQGNSKVTSTRMDTLINNWIGDNIIILQSL